MGNSLIDSIWYPQETSRLKQIISWSLSPLAWCYQTAQVAREKTIQVCRVSKPVVSVGNLTLGGNGKTPLVLHITQQLEQRAIKVAIVSRGYGRKTRGTRIIHTSGPHPPNAQEAGDEPAMLARRCPRSVVVVGADRAEAAQVAITSCAADIIVCDDAFQHRRLDRDLNIVAIHAMRGFGNRRLFPQGPLREPLDSLSRADLIVFTHAQKQNPQELARIHGIPTQIPVAACRFEPTCLVRGQMLEEYRGPMPRTVIAACAIANPQGFVESLQQIGLKVVHLYAKRDHERLTRLELTRLFKKAKQKKTDGIVVTEKDLVKIDPTERLGPLFALRIECRYVDSTSHNIVEAALQRVVQS